MDELILNEFKIAVSRDLSKLYAARNQLPEKTRSEFVSWFWKVRPLFNVNTISPNEVSVRVSNSQEMVPKGE